MGNKDRYKQSFFDNNLDRDSDFDLDEYIREQSQDGAKRTSKNTEFEQEEASQFKNAMLFFLVFAAAYLWYFDWDTSRAWNSIFGSNEAPAEVTSTAPSYTFTFPDIPDIPEIPDIPSVPAPTAENAGYIDYIKQINDAGLGEHFPSQAYLAFYESDIPVEFIVEINETGYLEQLSFTDLIILHENGGDIEYLDAMKEAGFFENFSTQGILIMQSAGVTIDFLTELEENGLLEGMSYMDVILAHSADN